MFSEIASMILALHNLTFYYSLKIIPSIFYVHNTLHKIKKTELSIYLYYINF